MHYEEYGNKDSSLQMVFLHGGGVSSWMWKDQLQYFDRYHCVAIDLPEQGLSKNTPKFSIKYSAEKIITILEKIGRGKQIVLIGFSLGAQVAIQILSKKHDLIDYCIINSAFVRPLSSINKVMIYSSLSNNRLYL